jgi:hypothetical protein
VNRALGTVVGFLYEQTGESDRPICPGCNTCKGALATHPMLPIVLVQFDELSSSINSKSFSREHKNVVPICATTCILPNHAEHTQLPLALASCITIHKSQGQSVNHLVMVLARMSWARGLGYVAISRCRSSTYVFFMMTGTKMKLTQMDFNMYDTQYESVGTALEDLATRLGTHTEDIVRDTLNPATFFADYTHLATETTKLGDCPDNFEEDCL